MKRVLIILFICFSFLLTSVYAKDLTIYAAASTTEVVQELAKEFKKACGTNVLINLASSGSLARQIEQGAPADIYISASKKWIDYLLKEKLLNKDYYSVFIYNSLVLIVPNGSELKTVIIDKQFKLPDMIKDRLAMGDPSHVPVGKYASQVLKYYGWDLLPDQYMYCKSTRDVLLTTELGEVDFGIVYKTDALKSKKVKIVGTFPEESHASVSYYVSLTSTAKDGSLAFYNFLLSDQAQKIYKKNGFITKLPVKVSLDKK